MLSWMMKQDGSINFVANGQLYQVGKDHKYYDDILEAIEFDEDESDLVSLYDKGSLITESLVNTRISKNVIVENGLVKLQYDSGHKVNAPDGLQERILYFLEKKIPLMPLVSFITKLMDNPRDEVVSELFDFLSYKGLPICEDGDFLAYKAVHQDGYDLHSRTVLYELGKSEEMPANLVCSDRNKGCDQGYHAGTLEYAQEYNRMKGNVAKIIVVKINPQHVVSVPADYGCQKLRTWKLFYLNDYSMKLDDVVTSDIMISDIEEFDEISFDYPLHGHGDMVHREAEVLRVYDDRFVCELADGEVRTFLFDKIRNLKYED